MKGLPAYYWFYRAMLKLWCIKHIVRPLLKAASERGMISGRRRV